MKRLSFLTILLIAAFVLAGCAGSEAPAGSDSAEPRLVVSGGEISKTYTRSDLQTLPASQATFKGVAYTGLTVSALLEEAGFDLAAIKALKAVAADGYSVNYDAAQVLAEDIIVAYATVDGELSAEDGDFRMVIPEADGKLNLRMLTELQVIP